MPAFIIRNKETKEQWVAPSGKKVWSTKAAAKNAYVYLGYMGEQDERPFEVMFANTYVRNEVLKFDKQDKFELVELQTEQDEISKALKEALDWLSDASFLLNLHAYSVTSRDIDKFIEETSKLLNS